MAAAETLGAFVNACGSAVRLHMPSILSALAVASGPTSPAALRTAAIRSLEFALHPLDNDEGEAPAGGAGGHGEGEGVSSPSTSIPPERLGAAVPVAVDAVTLLARVLAEDEEPEVALAAATSLETVVERTCRVGRALEAAAGAGAKEAAAALAGAVNAARGAADAVMEGAAACQAELAEGGGGGHEGGDGEDTGTVFMDLKYQVGCVLERCDGK